MKIRQPVSHSRAFAIIGIALSLGAWAVTVSAAMSSDSAFGDATGGLSWSWVILVLVDLIACGGAVLITRRALSNAHGDAIVDGAQFLARVSLIGVLGIALFMFAL